MVANDHRRSNRFDFVSNMPFLPRDKDPNEEKEAFVKLVIQSLKGIFAIFRKQVGR
jgi:hypothetical protein